MPRSKGISPLIASVVLIAFVIAIAALASSFFTRFASGRISEISDQGSTTVNCALSSVDFVDPNVTTNFSKAGAEIILTIENNGGVDLQIPSITYFNQSLQSSQVVATRKTDNTRINAGSPLTKGGIVTIHNLTVNADSLTKVIVQTNCPGVLATLKNDTAANAWKREFE